MFLRDALRRLLLDFSNGFGLLEDHALYGALACGRRFGTW